METLPPMHGVAPDVICVVYASAASALAGVLVTRGHPVIQIPFAPGTFKRIVDEDPALVLVEADLPGGGAALLCRSLAEQGHADRPLLVESSRPLSTDDRQALMHCGAWDCLTPEDPGGEAHALARIDALLRARRASVRDRMGQFLDQRTGLYNRLGLAHRARELGAQIVRNHGPLACLVIEVGVDPARDTESGMALCARVFQQEVRGSDLFARLGEREFAMLAPRTDESGALRIAERMARALKSQSARAELGGLRLDLNAAYDAIPDLAYVPIRPLDLVIHAAATLRERPRSPHAPWIRRSGPQARIDPPAA